MIQAALVFLETIEARRLAAAWPAFWPSAQEDDPDLVAAASYERWEELAGYSPAWSAERGRRRRRDLMEALRANGVCLESGNLHPLAERFIRDAALASVGIRVDPPLQ